MLTGRRLYGIVAALTVVTAILSQQVVAWGWLSQLDIRSVRFTKPYQDSRDVFTILVMVGLRGIILTVCLPWMGWLSWKRRSWMPIAGFMGVLLFETGLAGSLKLAIGRSYPYQNRGVMLVDEGFMAFPSGHAANAVALWGFVAWLVTRGHHTRRVVAYSLLTLAWCIVGVSSWILRTHWPTDIFSGFTLGAIAAVTVVGFIIAIEKTVDA